jgi:Magnesium chelatase, subunit ChlI
MAYRDVYKTQRPALYTVSASVTVASAIPHDAGARLTTIVPLMTLAEAIGTTRLHRVPGRTGDRTAVVAIRPCRAPHHTISDAGLIGGGHVPLPGEVSLAHNGGLFLDELPEFRRHVLEVLRQPLEEGVLYRQSPHVLNHHALAEFARRMMPLRDSWTAR